MIKRILFSAAVLFSVSVQAQKGAYQWRFGVLAGLDFTSGSPVPVSGSALNTNEGTACISDTSGSLLFYTDGQTIWNRNNTAMPNGTALMGGASSTQSALIVPSPANPNQYYVFTVDEIGGPNGFRYSIVDMTLDSARGDVTGTKNVLIRNNVTEKLTAVKHPDLNKYWIVVHDWGSDIFYAYELNTLGLQPVVMSHAGIVHNTSVIQNTYGQMKFSPCGDRLALAVGYQDTAQVFNFNVNTGTVSDAITLPFADHVYGVEFSRDAGKLYVTSYDPSATLVQFNLASGNQAVINATSVMLSTDADLYGLQLAPDGKIYVAKSFNPYLASVDYPDSLGILAQYTSMSVNLDTAFMGIGGALSLPGFVQSMLVQEDKCKTVWTSVEEWRSSFSVYPNPSGVFFTLSFPESLSATISIYDISGKQMESAVFNGTVFRFGENYPPGVYVAQIVSGAHVQTIRVLKSGN